MTISTPASYGANATYVIRNILAARHYPEYGDWTGVKTARVLRGCRRLERRGLVEEEKSRSAYFIVMKFWKLTDAGRAVIKQAAA